MHLAENLQRTEQAGLLPPQHELALGFYAKAMEQDWHLPVCFKPSDAVTVRVEARITSDREEPSAKILRNSVYHFTSNLTHSNGALTKHV